MVYIFFFAFVLLAILVVALIELRKSRKTIAAQLIELTYQQIHLEQSIQSVTSAMFTLKVAIATTKEQPNSKWMAQFEEYRKSGGTDDLATWLMCTESKQQFP